jgi:hypothetical protein
VPCVCSRLFRPCSRRRRRRRGDRYDREFGCRNDFKVYTSCWLTAPLPERAANKRALPAPPRVSRIFGSRRPGNSMSGTCTGYMINQDDMTCGVRVVNKTYCYKFTVHRGMHQLLVPAGTINAPLRLPPHRSNASGLLGASHVVCDDAGSGDILTAVSEETAETRHLSSCVPQIFTNRLVCRIGCIRCKLETFPNSSVLLPYQACA